MNERFRDRVLAMLDDALERLALGEIIDSIDFTLSTLATGPGQLSIIGLVLVNAKGSVPPGSIIGKVEVIMDLGFISTQPQIDSIVLSCLETIRAQRAAQLSIDNGHSQVG